MKNLFTFEHQQDLNRIRDTAMRMACSGLTTEELKRLNPNLLKSAPALYEALKYIIRALDEAGIIKKGSIFMLMPNKALAKVNDVSI